MSEEFICTDCGKNHGDLENAAECFENDRLPTIALELGDDSMFDAFNSSLIDVRNAETYSVEGCETKDLVRRKDVEQLIGERTNTMHKVEDNREGDRAEKANRVRHELEQLLEEVQNQ